MSTCVQETEFVFLKRRQFSRAEKLKEDKFVLFVTFQSAQVGVQVNGSGWGLPVDRCDSSAVVTLGLRRPAGPQEEPNGTETRMFTGAMNAVHFDKDYLIIQMLN